MWRDNDISEDRQLQVYVTYKIKANLVEEIYKRKLIKL